MISTTRFRSLYASRVKCTAFGRLALTKGEGEGEGLSGAAVVCAMQPLTSILSPSVRGEATEDPTGTKSVPSLPPL